ncbi:glycosyltransferase family 2 protein [Notoacmeibacter ruber]|nr:glycosyltransferase family 2 protein [Notoacmeibacter ruber]
MRFLPSFLKHYRSLGVDRFVFVDDGSEDGSVEFLSGQADVDLYTSKLRFAEARRGRLWREQLALSYGFDRWYINVDSDEYLIPPCNGKMDFKTYLRRIFGLNKRRIIAPMIDLYPIGSLSHAKFDAGSGGYPWDVADHFDRDGYRYERSESGNISIYGGPRHRVFGVNAKLTKYPVLWWDSDTSLRKSIHAPDPSWRNSPTEWGVLLHFKIFSDLKQQVAAVVENRQHYDGASIYKQMQDQMDTAMPESFEYNGSVHLKDMETLRSSGFLVSALDRGKDRTS